MPVCWAGNVSLNYPPKSLILDVGTNLAEKPSLNSQNTVEATGWSASKLGVGGILTPDDAMEKFAAGADLIQLITGIVFEGPGLIKEICERYAKEKM